MEIKVSVGSVVEADDELMIIESMKMHIPVAAPSPGAVTSIAVAVGDQVSEDDIVITLT